MGLIKEPYFYVLEVIEGVKYLWEVVKGSRTRQEQDCGKVISDWTLPQFLKHVFELEILFLCTKKLIPSWVNVLVQ